VEIKVTHKHLDRAIKEQLRGCDNTKCILAQLGNDIFGDNGGSGTTMVHDRLCRRCARFERGLGSALSTLNDEYQWGKLNRMLPVTIQYTIEER
jgi:hypothetical protein